MANHKSALKRIRQNERRRQRNKHAKTTMRTAVKIVRANVAAGDAEAARTSLVKAVRLLSRAAGKGIIPRERASRVTSRLTKAVSGI